MDLDQPTRFEEEAKVEIVDAPDEETIVNIDRKRKGKY